MVVITYALWFVLACILLWAVALVASIMDRIQYVKQIHRMRRDAI